jgi:HD superfamily phosphohydrolase
VKVIRDNLHGDIEFFPEEMRLLHTAGFERLHGCRQLGLTHLIYPAAKHSRFEHVLGVMHMATQIAERIKNQGHFFVGKEGEKLFRVLRFAALLHDMGHVPFGHTLEDEMPIIPKHDEPSAGNAVSRMERAVTEVLRDSDNEEYREPVWQVLLAIDASKDDSKLVNLVEQKKVGPNVLVLADIIGNTICADLLDYIKRDHMMTGIRATYDDRIFRYFGVAEYKGFKRVVLHLVKSGRVRNDALADLLDILKLRYNLSDKVLFHPKKCSADAMLIRAVADAGLAESDLMKFSDDGLLDNLADRPLIRMIRRWSLFKPVFVCGLANIATYDEANSKEDLITKLHVSQELRAKIERRIENEVGLPAGETSVIIYCPAPNMTLKPVRALVQWKDGTIRRLNEIKETDDHIMFEQISLLQKIYPQLWKLYLFVHPKLRKRGHSIREKFCDILDEEAGLSVTCDPAFQHYLDDHCHDYGFGRLLDNELQKRAAYNQLSVPERARVAQRCHDRAPVDKWDDDIAEAESITIASRGKKDTQAMMLQVNKIIDWVLQEPNQGSGQNQMDIPNM